MDYNSKTSFHRVYCWRCNQSGPNAYIQSDALAKWNTRPIEDELLAILERCRECERRGFRIPRPEIDALLAKAKGGAQ